MKCIVKGLSFFENDDGRRNFTTLAQCECQFPEIELTLAGVRLVHYPDKGYAALPPVAKLANGAMCVAWWTGGELAIAARDAAVEMFTRMGGVKPAAPKDAIDVTLEAVEAELAANGGSLSEAAAKVHERGDWRAFKVAATAEGERAVANAKSKAKLPGEAGTPATPKAAANQNAAVRRIAERKAVPVRTVEEIDATMPVEEMGLSRGLERTLGIAS